MKAFLLLAIGSLMSGTATELTFEATKERGGVIQDKDAAIAVVEELINSRDTALPCGKRSFRAMEGITSSEFKTSRVGSESRKHTVLYVDEWGVTEVVLEPDTNMTVGRLWSVDGRSGDVKLVAEVDWQESMEACSVANPDA